MVAKPDHATPWTTMVGFYIARDGDRRQLWAARDVIIFSVEVKKGPAVRHLFEAEAVDEVTSRINSLQPAAQRQWGKMDVAQMMAHCSAALDMASGRTQLPRLLIGRLIGGFIKPIFWNEKPFSKNNP